MHGGVVGGEVEGKGVGHGVGVAAGLQGVIYEESLDGAVGSNSDERGVVAVAVAGDGQQRGARAVVGSRPVPGMRGDSGKRANEVGAGGE